MQKDINKEFNKHLIENKINLKNKKIKNLKIELV